MGGRSQPCRGDGLLSRWRACRPGGLALSRPRKESGGRHRQTECPACLHGLIFRTPFAPPMPYPVKIQKDMPPVFLAAGGDDEVSASYPEVYRTLKDAGVPAELHLYSGVGHGFGMQRSIPLAAAGWTEQLWDWMFDRGLLSKK